VHVELAIHASEDLVAEVGQLLIVVSSVQSNGQLVLVRLVFETCSELAADEDEIVGVDGDVGFV
jgi:hypothetical protein